MKRKFAAVLTNILILSVITGFSQDIDIFNKQLNDNFNMPHIDKNMNFQEYQLLSRNLRMKDMLYAMIVPGYVHFYSQDNKLGYSMLGTRIAGYSGLLYVLAKNSDRVDLKDLLRIGFNSSIFPEDERTKYSVITTTSLIFIFGSYFFDWIHGQYILQKKQEEIRFKFSPHITAGIVNNTNINTGKNFNTVIPAIGFSVKF